MKDYIYGIYNITAASIDRYLQLNGWIRNYDFANRYMMVYMGKHYGQEHKRQTEKRAADNK